MVKFLIVIIMMTKTLATRCTLRTLKRKLTAPYQKALQ